MSKIVYVFLILSSISTMVMAQDATSSVSVQNETAFAAQNAVTEDPSLQETMVELAYGEFVKLADGSIVVSEYDATKDAQAQVSYIIDSQTKVSGVESVDKISAGSNIEISYDMVDGKKAARTITVEAITQE